MNERMNRQILELGFFFTSFDFTDDGSMLRSSLIMIE